MKFPKSLRGVGVLVHSHMGRVLNINSATENVGASTLSNATSGTRASIAMGHQFRPEKGVSLYQSTDATQYDYGRGPQVTAPHDANQRITTYPWPANPAHWEENPAGDRNEQAIMSGDLHVGPAPGRILRQMYERVLGNTAMPNVGGQVAMPYMESWLYMEHVKTPRKALGTKGPQKLSDDNAYIPASFAGNPRP